MAYVGKTKLTNLDTKGVAVVTSGANNKRFAISKADTLEQLFLEIIEKGDMPLDEKAIEDMCMQSGLDPQMTETVKAIMKLKHVYRDNAAFLGTIKQLMATGDAAAPQAGAQAGMPGAAPGAMPGPQPGAPTPGVPGQAPQASAPPFGKKPGADGVEGGDDMAAAEQELSAAAEQALEDEGGSEEAVAADEQDPPFMGDKKKEPPMSDKEEAKKMADLIAKAADADKKVADAEKKVAELELVTKAQKDALDINTNAVKKMQDDLRLAQWVAKADKELAFIAGKTADELGKMLFDIDTLNAEAAKAQFELLKAQAAIVKSSNLFRPSGSVGGAPVAASAWAEMEKRVGETITKSAKEGDTPEVARARAMQAIMKSDPELYSRYCAEQKDTNRAAFN